jgi:two-component system cell cycle response regulator DivK
MSKILIVDDNRMILHALSDHLEKMGYDTEVAASGLDALDYLQNEIPDLIIMDIIMPEMSGIEVTRKIREDSRIDKVPVVAFTSQSNQGQWEGLFDDYLVKPFGYDQLKEIIHRFLGDK